MLEEDTSLDFDSFLSAVESQEQSNAQQNQNQKGFEFPTCVQVGTHAIVRFVKGIPETAFDRDKPGTGRAKLFNTGWVKDDSGKGFPVVLPAIVKNTPVEKSTFCDFIDKVLTRVWVNDPDPTKKGKWNYIYSERADRGALGEAKPGELTLKDIFWNVFKSGHQPGDMYYDSQKSWRGQTVYVANVIDRLDYAWHQKNKKTKLLMRTVKVNGDRVNHKEISSYAISGALAELANNHGQKLDYDVLILPGPEAKDKFTLKNISKLKEIGYWDDYKTVVPEAERSLVSELRGFTEEEATWESIDIDKYYRYTPAATLLKHFGKTIRSFDNMVGTNFYDELKKEADADEAYRKSKLGTTETTPQSTPEPQPAASMTAVSQPVTQAPAAPQPAPQVAPAPSFDTMEPAATSAPEPLPTSEAAKAAISSFYDSLDD